MKRIKYNILQGIGLVMFLSGMTVMTQAAPKGVIVHNNTDSYLCVAFVKTKASLKGKLGLGTTKKYETLYETGSLIVQNRGIAPGQAVQFLGHERNIAEYDRVLWITSQENNCGQMVKLRGGDTIPAKGVVALEVGSKTNVVIVPAGKKYQLKSWTKKLDEELGKRRKATGEALKKAGLDWQSIKEASQAQWDKVSKAVKDAYAKLKKEASQAKRKVFGKSDKEIAAEVEGAPEVLGEGEEGGGEQPGLAMEGAGREGELFGFAAHGEEEPGAA